MQPNGRAARRRLINLALGVALAGVAANANAAGIHLLTVVQYPAFHESQGEYSSSAGLTQIITPGDVLTTSPGTMPLGLTGGSLTLSSPSGDYGFASASLAQGVVRSVANSGPLSNESVQTTAAVGDNVTFHISDGASSALVGVHVHLDGTETGAGIPQGTYSNDLNFSLGGSFDYFSAIFNNGNSGFGFNGASGSEPIGGWQSYSISNASLTGFDFDGLVSVTNGEIQPFIMSLNLNCEGAVQCDFAHTGRVTLDLPSDVTFTSDSGVFLTDTGPSGVPEPATWAVMLAGFGGIGAVMRARRRGAPVAA